MGDQNENLEFKRKDIAFEADEKNICGWLYIPKQESKEFPTIVMGHGFGALKEMDLFRFAEQFASDGFVVVVFDYSNFGDSEGYQPYEVNPWQQIEEYQHAITYAATLDIVDSDNIGVWGSSYSGGHVLVVAANDNRVKCLVSQVPTISGSQSSLRRLSPLQRKVRQKKFNKDRIARMQGKPAMMKVLVSDKIEDEPVYHSDEAVKWYLNAGKLSPNWNNQVTLRSVEYASTYDPGDYISKVSPVPLLMIVGTEDDITPTDLALSAYENALEPKKIVLLPGGHFIPYIEEFNQASEEAINWFKTHLIS